MKFIRFDVGIVRISIRKFILISSIALIASCGGSSGGGGGGDDDDDGADRFPTPTLPAGAVKIDAGNAAAIAIEVVDFTGILFGFVLKSEGSPSISQVIRIVTDQVKNRNRLLGSVAAGITEDISAFFCVTGTAIDTFTETSDGTSDSVTGEIVFSDCDLGGGIILNGTFPYEGSVNAATQDFDFQFGGTLTFADFIVNPVTIVLNFTESGNDGTGDFAFDPSFSLDGIPGGGYLVTTVLSITGNFDDVTDGELNVEGADNTQLCMTVTAINLMTVEFDDGLGGGCVPLAPPLTFDLS